MKTTKKYFLILVFYICSNSVFAQTLTYSNGPISTGAVSNSGVTAPTGYTWSECQNENSTETNSILGFSGFFDVANSLINSRIADDFTVPVGEAWSVSGFDFYCYQTGYTGSIPPITSLRVGIYNGNPSLASSTLIAGNLNTNIYIASSSADAMMYRIPNSSTPAPGTQTNTNNKIWKVRAQLFMGLDPGTYWVVVQGNTYNNATFSFVPVTALDSRGNGNGIQKNAGSLLWGNLVDGGNPASAPDINQDIAFNVHYVLLPLSNESFSKIESKLYPNPTSDSFVLSMSEEVKNNLKSVEIYNFLGQKVKEFSIQESYSIQEMSSGIYFAKLVSNSNVELKNIRIIKN